MEPLKKTATGITGLDEILEGGLPHGRPALLCGGPGCGKTLLAMEFLCRGALELDEPGLFVSFEEGLEDIEMNFASCTFGFEKALAEKRLEIISFPVSPEISIEAGDFTFDALLARLEHSLKRMGARRLALDSLRALFSRFSDTPNLRYEYARIFQWIKDQGVSAIVTTQSPERILSLHELEEYLSDCVIYMDHRITDQVSKRRIRVGKYRGSSHCADEIPFVLTSDGLSVLPITSLELEAKAPTEQISTGIGGLDRMLKGNGFYRGSTVLISGGAGTGKSTMAAAFARAACQKGDRAVYLAFEESTDQILRNMRSVAIDLEPALNKGLLRIEPIRPGRFGLEEHLVRAHTIIDRFKPKAVIVDPITSFTSIGNRIEIKSMLTRLLDYVKFSGITVFMTSLTSAKGPAEDSEAEISSIVDVWIIIQFQRAKQHRRRQLHVHKARGQAHSEETAELILSDAGIEIRTFTHIMTLIAVA